MENTESFKYSELSQKLRKEITRIDKKKNGIYFTPPETVYKNIERLAPYMKGIKKILEPSCGSCEYISQLKEKDVHITGIELNKIIFESIKDDEAENITFINADYLAYTLDSKFDLIIGNPPYFVMSKKDVESKYLDYFDGRPNIFILFIIKSLELLNKNGILSFVLPRNFLNSLYYDKTRKYIYNNYTIIDIMECNDSYIETQQATVIMIIQNKKPTKKNDRFSVCKYSFIVFGPQDNIKNLKELYKGSRSLTELGFRVSVGKVVWNECKKQLTDDSSKTLLVYSSDIKDNALSIQKYSNEAKKNYIDKQGSRAPLLVINRGYGVGMYSFNYCIINEKDTIEYLIENHLICIEHVESITKEKLIEKYKEVIGSFKNKKTKEFINIYFGNNAINTTELCNMLPIYE